MSLNFTRARPLLQDAKLKQLFVEELGWEPCRQQMDVPVGSHVFPLKAVAEKKGMVIWQCESQDGSLPDHATRLKLDRAVTQTTFEHLLVFVTGDRFRQSWMWVRREPGRPVRAHTHEYLRGQPGDSLLQKLQHLFVSLDEEEAGISVTDVAGRARTAFNVERLVKRFYEQFRKEHAAFLKFITGIPVQADHEWYTSVMLNRLMFVYFVQRKGFLDGDANYLRNRLQRMRQEHGKDKFYSFYRYFLLRLFHEGLGGKKRSSELDKLLGKIPYLNGGIFDIHELESPDRYGKDIQIPDKAFERIFDFFDQWHWHLDDRPVRADNEINPDVLGYIYEKYINQKQMGAYYTKEDITDYISKNTILPFLFDAARTKCKVAFENPNGPTLWDLLRNDPDRYIYPSVRHGADIPLPKDIEKGVNPPTLHQPAGDGPVLTLELRKGWNKVAPAEYALPTETWREVVVRRQRYEDIRRKLAAGEVRDINEIITLNLDIRQFAQDVIAECEGPDLLRAFWHAIEKVTVLDPTCGSGAFLFAALNILEPLYEACLDRMEAFLQDEAAKTGPAKLKQTPHGYPLLPNGRLKDFSDILDHVAGHPSKHYFVYKSIILNNLYGVDIMEEAVEICKLRLFLKLAAQVEPDDDKPNHGIEPLPDIDFNIRAGNTLVGFASMDEIRRVLGSDLEKMLELPAIEEKAAEADRQFRLFREMQTERGMDAKDFASAKRKLRERLKALEDELNHYLATDYGIKPGKKPDFEHWRKTHQPFHWFIDFYGILNENGGFDVIIGNPPYVEHKVATNQYQIKDFTTLPCGNLYAFVVERSYRLAISTGRIGLIVPISITAAQRMSVLQDLVIGNSAHLCLSNFALRPAALFPGVMQRLSILISQKGSAGYHFVTDYIAWYAEERAALFPLLAFHALQNLRQSYSIPKIKGVVAHAALSRILTKKRAWSHHNQFQGQHTIFYHNAGGYWIKTFDFRPYYKSSLDPDKKHTTISALNMPTEALAHTYLGLLNSSLFYFFWKSLTDARHVYPSDIAMFPIELPLDDGNRKKLLALCTTLMNELRNCRQRIVYGNAEVDQYSVSPAKPIIDQIDTVLARHYGFTEEELDFIINYDIKYRMGRGE